MSSQQWAQEATAALNQKNGAVLASLVSLAAARDRYQFGPSAATPSALQQFDNQGDLGQMLRHIVGRNVHCRAGNPKLAFNCQVLALRAFQEEFKQAPTHFGSPKLLSSLALSLRILALQADAENDEAEAEDDDDESGHGATTMFDQAYKLLATVFFPLCNRAPPEPNSRRWSALPLVNQILKLCFLIDQTPLCKPLMDLNFDQPVGRNIVAFGRWPKADRVTYCVYKGRMAVLNGDYITADSKLTYALANCHRSSSRNRRQILLLLVPVRLVLGVVPSTALLEKHLLADQFLPVVTAMRQGDVGALKEALEAHSEFFLHNRIYLVLNSLISLSWRNLFKRVWVAEGMPRKLQLRSCVCGARMVLRPTDEPMDIEVVSGLASNLISFGFMKGQLWLAEEYIVLRKENPFPPIQEIYT